MGERERGKHNVHTARGSFLIIIRYEPITLCPSEYSKNMHTPRERKIIVGTLESGGLSKLKIVLLPEFVIAAVRLSDEILGDRDQGICIIKPVVPYRVHASDFIKFMLNRINNDAHLRK